MARPIYMLCSQAGCEDKTTGLVSHFLVVEKLELQKRPTPDGKVLNFAALPLQIVAVWSISEEEEYGREFEYAVSLYTPPECQEEIVASGTFHFTMERWRFSANIQGFAIFHAGRFKAECKIRQVGSTEWLIQSYDFPVTYTEPEADEEDTQGEAGEAEQA